MPICTTTLYHFDRVTGPKLLKIISGMNKTTCSSDTFPTRLLMPHLHAIVPILQHIVNLCLTTGDFPISYKASIVLPLIKKPGLDRGMLKKYRAVSNLSFYPRLLRGLFLFVFYITIFLIVFSLLIGQATVVRPLYFVCTMILSQPLERAMDHF